MRPALALALAVAGAASCHGRPAPPEVLRVLDWSGRDGAPVPLDQPLVVTFSESLQAPIRPSALTIATAEGAPCTGFHLEARGPLLLLYPRLPCAADLADGSLPPAATLSVRLAGWPRLQAVAGESGAMLEGDALLPFRTSPADEPAALSGFPSAESTIRILGLIDSGLLRLPAAREGAARLRFSSALDPRSLGPPARLEPDAAGARLADASVPLRLIENGPDGAVVELALGEWSGRATLYLPEGIEGPGGRPLDAGARRLRLWRAP